MAVRESRFRSVRRSHIILIPGFAGFDALGQMEYYSCITPLFQRWKSGNEVLHYFDNFPTAAVVTRARRLREYLTKRIARGEISEGDDITLIGHSTGGLDIRCLLSQLKQRDEPVPVDGGVEVSPAELFKQIRRVVFLSVPHWGTNIADWVQAHWVLREVFIENLRATVAGSQLSPLERVESAIAANTASMTDAALFDAMQDALDEANEDNGERSPYRKAEAHEAASELALYLRHMASDFRAIDDLTSRASRQSKHTNRKLISPAHFNPMDREAERQQLRNIEFRSYITLGTRAFQFDSGKPAPLWELAKPWTYPEISKDAALSVGTDWVYRLCYRACAGGPFDPPKNNREQARQLSPRHAIEVWDNDGIVNTLSMFWQLGENVLVRADHMDIVGQYKALPADRGAGRKSRTYDLLKSHSRFNDKVFEEIWTDIFAFALGRSNTHQNQSFAVAGGRE